jgi:hypothetical protein
MEKECKNFIFLVIICRNGWPSCSQIVNETISFSEERDTVHHRLVEEDNFQSDQTIRFDVNDIFWYSPGSL